LHEPTLVIEGMDCQVKPGNDDPRGQAKIVRERSFWVYILANRPNGTIYVGVTNNLIRRVYEHREGFVGGFTKKYGVKMLVYFEQHATAMAAIQREKNIKHWSRNWKIDLIRSMNPEWKDLYNEIAQ